MADKRPKMKRPLPVRDLLDAVFAGKPAAKRLREAVVWRIWEEAVGPQIASRAAPVSFRNGTLTVRVSGSAWMQQLAMMKHDIITQLNGSAGEALVSDIFFRQGNVEKKTTATSEEPVRKRPLTDAELQAVNERTAVITDPELRDACISLFSSHIAAAPRKQNL